MAENAPPERQKRDAYFAIGWPKNNRAKSNT
jgi:hypothetical protein